MSLASGPIHILGISGSIRSGSFSTALLKALAKRSSPDYELTLMTLTAIPFYNEDLDRDPQPIAVAEFRNAIACSDGVVIVSPEYNHGIPGVLKNGLDWASRPASQSCFRDKPALIMTSSPAFTGGVRAQYQLRETLASMLAQVVTGPEVVIAGVHSKMTGGEFTDAMGLDSMSDALARLVKHISRVRTTAAA